MCSAGAEGAEQGTDPARNAALERFLQTQRVTAWLRTDYFQSSNGLDGKEHLLGPTLQIKALPHFGDFLDTKFEGRVTAPDVRGRSGYGPRSELLEGFATLHLSRIDVRVGKQIVAWGRADGINPTDNLTPRDFLVLLPLEEDQRFGTWGLRLDAYVSHAMTVEVFATPSFRPDKFPLPTAGAAVEVLEPGHSLANTELGLKLNEVSDEIDWSLSYFRGYSLLPTVATARPPVQLFYAREQVLGADVARNFGRFGFRSEIALTLPQDGASSDPNAGRHRLFWVSGVDRTFLDNLNLNLQLFLRWMPRRDEPTDLFDSTSRTASQLNAIVGGQEAQTSPGLTFRVSKQWLNDTLRLELLSLTNFRRADHYLRPLASYDLNDRMRISTGANLYGGPRDTQYGLLRRNNGVYAEFRYALW